MSKISGLHFYINDELNLVIDDCRGETVRHKVISLNTFCKLIDKTSEVKDIQTGVLPERCISYRESQKGTKYITLEMGSYMQMLHMRRRSMSIFLFQDCYTDLS